MNTSRFVLAALLAASIGSMQPGGHARAQEGKAGTVKLGTIEISDLWARATPRGVTVGAGYFKITNTGSTPDRLVGGTSEVADDLEIHEMSMTGGVMRMRPLKNGVVIEPGASVELKPSSYHLMFVGLKRPLQQGQKIKTMLTFEKAGSAEAEFAVQPVGSPGPGGRMHGH